MIRKNFWILGFLCSVALFSCRKNSSSDTFREYSEVAVENDASIQAYLKTHFYTLNTDGTVNLDSIAGINAGKTPLFDQVSKKVLKVTDIHGKQVDHTLYYLVLREGSGAQATIADSTYIVYKGQTLSGAVFDQSIGHSQRNWFDLLGSSTRSGTVIGFRESVSQLKASSQNLIQNSDGTTSLPDDYGIGIFFMPSGLAYFSSAIGGETYVPLIFQIGLIYTKNADHDNDGIPTINEIEYNETDGTITYPDCNGNGIVDYLDARKCN